MSRREALKVILYKTVAVSTLALSTELLADEAEAAHHHNSWLEKQYCPICNPMMRR